MLEQEGGRNRFGENGNEIGSRNVKRAGISRRETRIAKNYKLGDMRVGTVGAYVF